MAGFHPQMYRLFLRQSSLRVACREIATIAASGSAARSGAETSPRVVSSAVHAGACVRVTVVSSYVSV